LKTTKALGAEMANAVRAHEVIERQAPNLDDFGLRSVWVIFDGFSGGCRLVEVRFAPEAPKPGPARSVRLAGRL
jgi:hypothetical protein